MSCFPPIVPEGDSGSGSYTLPDTDPPMDIPDFYVDDDMILDDPGVTYDTDHPDVDGPLHARRDRKLRATIVRDNENPDQVDEISNGVGDLCESGGGGGLDSDDDTILDDRDDSTSTTDDPCTGGDTENCDDDTGRMMKTSTRRTRTPMAVVRSV